MTTKTKRETQTVLTIRAGEDVFAIQALNPGESVPAFFPGGQSLTVRETGSIVVLRVGRTSGTQNIEYGLRDDQFWGWIARLINGVPGVTAQGRDEG